MRMITFRKLYEKPREGDFSNAIIIHQKKLERSVVKTLSREEAEKVGCRTRETAFQYSNKLRIDLWLVQLNFEWGSSKRIKR